MVNRRAAYFIGISRIEMAGQRAFAAGQTERDCPYSYRRSSRYQRAWIQGFNEAKREAELQAWAKAAYEKGPDGKDKDQSGNGAGAAAGR